MTFFVAVFERFTDGARRVLVVAQDEARTLDHDFLGTGHLLLGLIGEQQGVAARVLLSSGITVEAAREQLTIVVGRSGRSAAGSPPFTPVAKSALELSLREALQFGRDGSIDTEHLLLGITDEGGGDGVDLLLRCGIIPSEIRTKVIEMIGGLPPDYRRPVQRDRALSRLAPAGFGRRPILDEDELDPMAWGVLSWRQAHLPLSALRSRKDWEYLQRLEQEAANRLYDQLNLHGEQWASLLEHHGRRVQSIAHLARPDVVPDLAAPQQRDNLHHGREVAVLHGRRQRGPQFLYGWACWFGNRRASLRYRWEWLQTRRFALRTRAAYRNQPRPR